MKGKHIKLKQFGTDRIGFTLEGNPEKPEPTYASIEFPGGEITLARTSDGCYWAHINCFRSDGFDESEAGHRRGRFTDSRIDTQGQHASEVIGGDFARPDTYHVAVKIEVE